MTEKNKSHTKSGQSGEEMLQDVLQGTGQPDDSQPAGTEKDPIVIQTDAGAVSGETKCPMCGATDISLNTKTGMLRCNFCRHEFENKKTEGFVKNLTELNREIIGSGAKDIQESAKDIITFKCSACGAEVVVDTAEAQQARCHWCRNTLSVNEQIPNGAVPDTVLPFSVNRKEAKIQIEDFVGKRKFYAHPKFRQEFSVDNVMGVYLPYMLLDVNTHASFSGEGEVEVRHYTETIRHGKDREEKVTYYDADLYGIRREFDMTAEGLSIESSSDKRDRKATDRTNNIINSIMPFDTENCVQWDANFLKGYTSEKRDTNIDQLRPIADVQIRDIARNAAGETIKKYDRGVRWDQEDVDVKGRQWKTAYLPVWLYSYQEEKGENKGMLHYVAVNARTKETMGSVPINTKVLLMMSALVEVLALVLKILVNQTITESPLTWIFLIAGFVYYFVIHNRYRNAGVRHAHERETKRSVSSMKKADQLIQHKRRLRNSSMNGANSNRVEG